MTPADLLRHETFATEARFHLFPSLQEETAQWIKTNIGPPEFGWDEQSVFAGFFKPANRYIAVVNPEPFGSLTVSLLEAYGKDVAAMRPLIETTERIALATRAFEDLLFAYRYKQADVGFGSAYGGVIGGSITSTLLGQMYNIFLRQNQLALDDSIRLQMYNFCSRESVRMRYVAAMQLGWMNDDSHHPAVADAVNYAVNGPIGAGLRISLTLAAMSLGLTDEERDIIRRFADTLCVIHAIRAALLDVSEKSTRPRGEDFRVGKVTPLTVLASQDRKLHVKKIWGLQGAFSLWTILHNAIAQVLAFSEHNAAVIANLASHNPGPTRELFLLWAEGMVTDAQNLSVDLKNEATQ